MQCLPIFLSLQRIDYIHMPQPRKEGKKIFTWAKQVISCGGGREFRKVHSHVAFESRERKWWQTSHGGGWDLNKKTGPNTFGNFLPPQVKFIYIFHFRHVINVASVGVDTEPSPRVSMLTTNVGFILLFIILSRWKSVWKMNGLFQFLLHPTWSFLYIWLVKSLVTR